MKKLSLEECTILEDIVKNGCHYRKFTDIDIQEHFKLVRRGYLWDSISDIKGYDFKFIMTEMGYACICPLDVDLYI